MSNQTTAIQMVPTVNDVPITIDWVERKPHHAFMMIKHLAEELQRAQTVLGNAVAALKEIKE